MNPSKIFNLQGGKSVKDLKGLAKELARMPLDVYEHHVKPTKNDFANWIRHSLSHDELAASIDGQITRIEMELQILRHLVHEKDRPKKASVKKKVAKKVVKKVVKKAAKKVSNKVSAVSA
ncbi:MAG: hypothetical protein H6500_00750 [Candidatus Woesearchaeota archaeon]|nr:MAG: hypothetical protein H6500_00750 [Candidatus Woesearchaeota archaeon]